MNFNVVINWLHLAVMSQNVANRLSLHISLAAGAEGRMQYG